MGKKAKANWLDPGTTAENEVLPGYFKWAWMSRALSLGLNVILLMQLTYYCTDMLGMTPGLVGGLLLASKIFDGITDICVGYFIDRTNTKWGKARPYEIFIVFIWGLTILLFSAPKIGTVGLSIYVFVLYTLINSVCATFLNGGDAVYLARSVRSDKNRVSVMSFNGGMIMIFSILINIVFPQLIAGIGAEKSGWTVIALIFAVPLGIIGMFRFIFIKEIVNTTETGEMKKTEAIPLKTGLKCLFKNKYIFILSGMTLVVQLCTNIGNAVNTYYFKYIVGDIGLGSIVFLSSVLTPVLLFLFPLLSKKFGTVGVLKIGAIVSVAGYAVRIVGGTNIITLLIGSLFSGIGAVPISMMVSIYLIDCMDYGEYKTGTRVEGLISSVNSFCNKLGSGVASGMVGLIMGLAGYEGALAVQSASANASISILFNWIPLVLMVIMLVLAIAYKLDKEMPEIKKELEMRKALQNGGKNGDQRNFK